MIKYTHKENQSMMAALTLQAYMVGLIQPDEKLVYEKGGRGTATVIRLVRVEEDQKRTALMRPQWVPEFGYKDGPSVVGNALVIVSNVLYSIETAKSTKRIWPASGTETADSSRNSYRRGELENVDASGEYPAKIKIFSDAGDTKHLNITATEFEQIRNVLLDYRND